MRLGGRLAPSATEEAANGANSGVLLELLMVPPAREPGTRDSVETFKSPNGAMEQGLPPSAAPHPEMSSRPMTPEEAGLSLGAIVVALLLHGRAGSAARELRLSSQARLRKGLAGGRFSAELGGFHAAGLSPGTSGGKSAKEAKPEPLAALLPRSSSKPAALADFAIKPLLPGLLRTLPGTRPTGCLDLLLWISRTDGSAEDDEGP